MNSDTRPTTSTPSDAARPRPKILFATIAAGGSHVSTAQAMREALERHRPGRFELTVCEPMVDYGFRDLDERHKEGWKRALRNPWSIVWGQRLIDAFPAATLAFHRRLLDDFAREAAARLNAERPELVVVNHGWLTVALTLAQLRYGLEVPVLTFETSTLNANALWAEPAAERFIVGSSVSKGRLMKFGIPASRIDIVGYPVRDSFLSAPDKGTARRALGLADAFTCLVSLGGEGVGGSPEGVLEALRHTEDLQVVVVTGRNQELRRRLERFADGMAHLRILGFIEEMAVYLAASDVVIGKTGPATVYETIAVGRPLLAPSRFGKAENKMLQLLERNGLGHYLPDPGDLAAAVKSYRDEPQRLAEVERRSRELDFPGMARRLALYLSHYAETREPDEGVCGMGIALPFEG